MQLIGNGIGIPFQRKVGGGFVGLLDEVSGAAFAASVRLLRADYAGGLLRARANDGTTDQGEADVLPYDDGGAERFISLDSRLINLDATAIGRGLTTSDTLGDLLDVGSGNYDGFVPTLYDQAGSSINAVQAVASRQPKIATAGVLEVENGKPAIVANSQFFSVPGGIENNGNPLYTYCVYTQGVPGVNKGIFGDWSGTLSYAVLSNYFFSPNNFSAINVDTSGARTDINTAISLTNGTQYLINVIFDSNIEMNYNNINASNSAAITPPGNGSVLTIFGYDNGVTTVSANSKIQELVLYSINQSLNNSAIQSDINNLFSIYP